MSKNVKMTVDGEVKTYNGISTVQIPTAEGGTAEFKDVDEITTPIGSVNITENGTHDVSAYAQAVVNVPSGDNLVAMVDGSISGVIALPDSVKELRDNLFAFTKITGIEMPGVTKIGGNVFKGCADLVLTELPSVLEEIGIFAFNMCTNVVISQIPASVKKLSGSFIFYQSGTKSLTFLGKPDEISSSALGGVDTVNVPWEEGEVANAPWGAKTINYNYTGE